MSNRIKCKILFLILCNFVLGMVTALHLLLPSIVIESRPQPLGLAWLITTYAVSFLLYLSVAYIDYRVYKVGLEKGILFKGEKA